MPTHSMQSPRRSGRGSTASTQSSRSSLSSMVSIDSVRSADYRCYTIPPPADFVPPGLDPKVLCKVVGTVTKVDEKRTPEDPRYLSIHYTDVNGQPADASPMKMRGNTLPAVGEKLYRVAEPHKYRYYSATDLKAKRKAREQRILNDDTVSEVVTLEHGYLLDDTAAGTLKKKQRVTYTKYGDVKKVKSQDNSTPGMCMVRTWNVHERDWQPLRYDEGEIVGPNTPTYFQEWTTDSGEQVERLLTKAVVMRQKRNRRAEWKGELAKKAELVKKAVGHKSSKKGV